jgi:hypothetical protein
MTTKNNTPTIALESLSTDDLARLAALVADTIAARQLQDAITTDLLTPMAQEKKARKSDKRDTGSWEEIKVINGHQYRYRRTWQGGKLRSKYIGKA